MPKRKSRPTYERFGPGHPSHFENQARRTAEAAAEGDAEAARRIFQSFISVIDRQSNFVAKRLANVPVQDRTTDDAKHWAEMVWRERCSGMTYFAYVRYIADALRAILANDGLDARVALGLKRSDPGRRAGDTRVDHRALSAARALLRAHGLSAKSADSNLLEKISGASSATARRASKNFSHHDQFRRWAVGQHRDYMLGLLEVDAVPYCSEIAAILERKQASKHR